MDFRGDIVHILLYLDLLTNHIVFSDGQVLPITVNVSDAFYQLSNV
jgi:hypothetical protein